MHNIVTYDDTNETFDTTTSSALKITQLDKVQADSKVAQF